MMPSLDFVDQEAEGAFPRPRPNGHDSEAAPSIIDAGEDEAAIPPRGWLLGNAMCRGFISGNVAQGGVGKTALAIARALALATGRPLTGEHVFQRCRVLVVSLEDDIDELRRRVRAAENPPPDNCRRCTRLAVSVDAHRTEDRETARRLPRCCAG